MFKKKIGNSKFHEKQPQYQLFVMFGVIFIWKRLYILYIYILYIYLHNTYIYIYKNTYNIYTWKSKLSSTHELNVMYRNKWENQMTMRTLYKNTTGFWCLCKYYINQSCLYRELSLSSTFLICSYTYNIYIIYMYIYIFIYIFIHLYIYMSFWSAVVKIYPFATLCWVNEDENIYIA